MVDSDATCFITKEYDVKYPFFSFNYNLFIVEVTIYVCIITYTFWVKLKAGLNIVTEN